MLAEKQKIAHYVLLTLTGVVRVRNVVGKALTGEAPYLSEKPKEVAAEV